METPALFAASVLILLIMPGPTNTLLATSGATVGFQRSMPLLLGELAGYMLSILLIEFVLGPAISSTPLIASVLRIVAGAYLMLVAVKLWTTPFRLARAVISLRQVFITTLLNPKAFVFALVIIPFGSPRSPVYFSSFLASVPTVGTVWIVAGCLLGRHAQAGYARSLPRAASIVLAIISASLIGSAFFTLPAFPHT
jgi:threonine/homoserine/homoserine lactone efflux protein